MKLLTVMTLALSVAFSMGCSSSAANTPSPAATPILTHELKVIADPQPAAKFLFNPIPLERDKYVHGRTVTIDVLPQLGWEIGEWVGPVFGVSGRTAKIAMDSSQRVVVRMIQPSTLGTAPSPSAGSVAEPPQFIAQPLPPSIPSDGIVDTPMPPATLTSGSSSNPNLGPVVLCLAKSRTAYFEGKALNDQGEWERAIEKLGEAISLDQRCASAYSSRGFAYLHTGQSQQAIQD